MYRYQMMTLLGYAMAGQQRWTTAASLLRSGYEGLLRTATVAEDQEQIGEAGDLVVKAYAQWGK
jgi:hypothetical protein